MDTLGNMETKHPAQLDDKFELIKKQGRSSWEDFDLAGSSWQPEKTEDIFYTGYNLPARTPNRGQMSNQIA